MADGRVNNGGPRPKTRPDDKRGAAKGGNGITGLGGGGSIGQQPFVPTDAQRARVRQLAKAFPHQREDYIAALMGFSLSTLHRHFREELTLGRAELVADVAAQFVARAIDHKDEIAKGDIDAQKFVLVRMGGWLQTVAHTGKDGGPIQTMNYDLSSLSEDQKRAILPVLDQLLGEAERHDDGDEGSS